MVAILCCVVYIHPLCMEQNYFIACAPADLLSLDLHHCSQQRLCLPWARRLAILSNYLADNEANDCAWAFHVALLISWKVVSLNVLHISWKGLLNFYLLRGSGPFLPFAGCLSFFWHQRTGVHGGQILGVCTPSDMNMVHLALCHKRVTGEGAEMFQNYGLALPPISWISVVKVLLVRVLETASISGQY